MLSNDDVVSIKTTESEGRSVLEIADVVIDDEGDYVCKASNPVGVTSTKAFISVKEAETLSHSENDSTTTLKNSSKDIPNILDHLQGQTVKDGETLTLQCSISVITIHLLDKESEK
ncbi:hypothetical protein LOTGIDRAFT_163161 [Lottia gigantea]|uniref:Immunoglobulin I-set domain-containing protein n=1 Tax=Lottia gigantea TaxID=225164 RepID=V4AEM5_LOTGI|nr:hypothetical protein LOTGIDRAFT_163161 [Lottia gigantea]ESO91801.1 hypothetical protein LOTGIDRAFT_163161 [Lottia gigantea]